MCLRKAKQGDMAAVAAHATDAPPPVMSFAVMRNSHEAICAAIAEMDPMAADFAAKWEAYHRFLTVHMAIEDQAMFLLLEEISPGACKPLLSDQHAKDHV